MKKTIYDIRSDKSIQKAIEERAQYFEDDFYVSAYGRYGTSDWWDNLEISGLLSTEKARVESMKPDGKATIAMLKLKMEDQLLEVVMKGKYGHYNVGDNLEVTMAKNADIFTDGSEGWELLRVEKLAARSE